jgi:hypothetical protein
MRPALNWIRLALAAGLLLFVPSVFAKGELVSGAAALQTAVALNGSQAARTSAAINVTGYSVLRLTYAYTRVAGTDFDVHCESSDTGSSGWRHIDPANSDREYQAGDPIYSYASLTSSRTFDVRIGIASFKFVRCYPTVTSAGATDVVTTTYSLFY